MALVPKEKIVEYLKTKVANPQYLEDFYNFKFIDPTDRSSRAFDLALLRKFFRLENIDSWFHEKFDEGTVRAIGTFFHGKKENVKKSYQYFMGSLNYIQEHGKGLRLFVKLDQEWKESTASLWAYVIEYFCPIPKYRDSDIELTALTIWKTLTNIYPMPVQWSQNLNGPWMRNFRNITATSPYQKIRGELILRRRQSPSFILAPMEILELAVDFTNYLYDLYCLISRRFFYF